MSGHDEHHGSRFLQHHFDTDEQQFDSAKLGMWLFLVTEVLFFSGLFCAYAVYRSLNPEIFLYSHQYLDKWLGAINTIVLILSSFTIAWGVRCAQLGNRKLLIQLLGITLFCAAVFMGVKAFEYSEKWYKSLLPHAMAEYRAKHAAAGTGVGILKGEKLTETVTETLRHFELILLVVGGILAAIFGALLAAKKSRPLRTMIAGLIIIIAGVIAGSEGSLVVHHIEHALGIEHGGSGITEASLDAAKAEGVGADPETYATGVDPAERPEKTLTFFSIYFCLTGLHAFHILAGMVVIIWILVRSVENHFNSEYFGPVDFVGLYWHLVDLIWIYLFPLLYLIG